jgi:hypothetical protein
LQRSSAESVCNSERIPYERTRRIFIPGVAAILTVWLVQSALLLFHWSSWILRVHIPFTRRPLFMHWDLIVSFAVAGAISALYGAFLNSSPKQRYIAALFPVLFEILKWLWLLRFPMAPWIDPAAPPYRFLKLLVAASIGCWVIHIIIPAAALLERCPASIVGFIPTVKTTEWSQARFDESVLTPDASRSRTCKVLPYFSGRLAARIMRCTVVLVSFRSLAISPRLCPAA